MFLSMVLVRLLYKEHAFDHLPSLGLPALLGMDQGAWNLVLCTMFLGFPTGSVFVDEAVRDGVLSRQDAARLLYCCCFPTPGFVIISCGIVFFKSLHIGMLLFALQLLSGLLLLLFTRRHTVHTFPAAVASSQSFMRNLSSAVTESGISLYMIGGYLMLFMSVTAVLFSFLPEFPALIIRSLAEIFQRHRFDQRHTVFHYAEITPYQLSAWVCRLLCTYADHEYGGTGSSALSRLSALPDSAGNDFCPSADPLRAVSIIFLYNNTKGR